MIGQILLEKLKESNLRQVGAYVHRFAASTFLDEMDTSAISWVYRHWMAKPHLSAKVFWSYKCIHQFEWQLPKIRWSNHCED